MFISFIAISLCGYALLVSCCPDPDANVQPIIHPRAFTVPKSDFENPRPWPDRSIPYCFKDLQTKRHVEPFFQEAINLWNDRGAYIDFTNVGGDGFCPTDGDVIKESLVVSVKAGKIFKTTVGFYGSSQIMDLGKEKHKHPDTDKYKKKWVYGIAHELGHAIGFQHEHQRPGAEKFVTINYENLAGYDDVRNKVMKEDGGHNKEERLSEACTDLFTARQYEFWGAMNFMPLKGGYSNFLQEPKDELDWDSIMMYGSRQGGKKRLGGVGKKATVMTVKEGVANGPKRIKEVYERPPSEKDINALNRMYEEEEENENA